ncbi:MAG: hypothetical protein VCA55_02695 [Verrucomicrobiales bacterium]
MLKAALSVLSITLFLGACSQPYSSPAFVAPEGQDKLVARIRGELRDLETATGKHFRGRTIEVRAPTSAAYADWRGMPVAKIRGTYQGGLTAWKILERNAIVYLAHAKGTIPDWLIRHEALHIILLSNGIPGHPRKYSKYFTHSYWWMPEEEYQRKVFSQAIFHPAAKAACPVCRALPDYSHKLSQ